MGIEIEENEGVGRSGRKYRVGYEYYGDEGEQKNSESEVGQYNDSYTTGNYVQTNDEDNDDDNDSFHEDNNGFSDD